MPRPIDTAQQKAKADFGGSLESAALDQQVRNNARRMAGTGPRRSGGGAQSTSAIGSPKTPRTPSLTANRSPLGRAHAPAFSTSQSKAGGSTAETGEPGVLDAADHARDNPTTPEQTASGNSSPPPSFIRPPSLSPELKVKGAHGQKLALQNATSPQAAALGACDDDGEDEDQSDSVSQKSSSGYEERPAPASASTTVDINLDHASELFMHHIRKIVSAQTARGDHAEAQAAKLGERVKTLEEQARDSESKYAQAEKDAKKFLDVANENIEKLQEEVRGLSRKVEETQAASEKEKEERREERKEYERILDAEIAARKSAEGSRDQAREELAALHRQNELLRERDEARAKNFEQVVSLAKRLNQDFSAALNEALEEARAVPQQELPAAAE